MAHDAGAAIGAAAWASGQAGERPRIPAEARLGVDFTSDDISSVLRQANIRARRIDDPASEAAARIEQGEVIGWFQSRVEVGPRALGARSILASPSDAANKQRVNRIKGREQWRPLAPSALADETGWMFGRPIASPFMLRSHALTAEACQRVPAVAHVDGSTRVQTVDADPQDSYARLLEELRRRTGTGVVLNTSFNAAFEPIVCTPADAIRTFSILGLDALILGEFLLEK
jgi:carbamoyltransferase